MAVVDFSKLVRGYQTDGMNMIRAAFSRKVTRILFYSPTGSGKGTLIAAISYFGLQRGNKILVLVNRQALVHQQVARFEEYGISVGVLQGSNTYKPNSPITVGSIQTLARREKMGWKFDCDLLIIDEAHSCAGSEQYKALLSKWNNVKTIGFTATPWSKGLGKKYTWGRLFEELIVGATIPELINAGYLCDVDVFAPSEPDLSKVSIVAGEYHQKELGEAVDKPKLIGDIVSHWGRLAKGKQTICFATNIAHSKAIVEQFRGAGVIAEHADCYISETQRLDLIDRFKRGEITVLSNCSLFAEGFDAPATECMILARPTRSLVRYIQMVGRVLRPFDGKDRALLLDHSGSARRLPYPTDEIEMELDDGMPKKSSDSKPKEKLPKVCPKCAYVDPKNSHKCPDCGFTPERQNNIKEGEGTLVKINKESTKADKQAIYSALIGHYDRQIAEGKNWSSGWPYKNYMIMMHGVKPHGLRKEPGPMVESVRRHIEGSNKSYRDEKKAEDKAKLVDFNEERHRRNRETETRLEGCIQCKSSHIEFGPGVGPHFMAAKCSKCHKHWWVKR